GHVSLCFESNRRCDELFGDSQAVRLGLDLRLELRNFRVEALDHGSKTVRLGFGALLLGRDLPLEKILLRIQRIQHGSVDVKAIRGDLVCLHRQQGLMLLDLWPVFCAKMSQWIIFRVALLPAAHLRINVRVLSTDPNLPIPSALVPRLGLFFSHLSWQSLS